MTANHRAANIESAEERGYWKGYHAAIRKCDAETIKMLDMELLAKSGKQLKGVIVPIIEKAKQEAYAKGKADGFEEVAKTCSECQRTQYKRGQADLIEKLKPFVAKYEGYDCVLWKIVEARASESAGADEHALRAGNRTREGTKPFRRRINIKPSPAPEKQR